MTIRSVVNSIMILNWKMMKKPNGWKSTKSRKWPNLTMFYKDSKRFRINWFRRQRSWRGKRTQKHPREYQECWVLTSTSWIQTIIRKRELRTQRERLTALDATYLSNNAPVSTEIHHLKFLNFYESIKFQIK